MIFQPPDEEEFLLSTILSSKFDSDPSHGPSTSESNGHHSVTHPGIGAAH